ncbi:hypothetical protein X949_5655 [Burkholderia pseudomallei MSHR5609]|nr:hypothetical protein X949_5655 [Burkholderia pseudomallei MSHR5609]
MAKAARLVANRGRLAAVVLSTIKDLRADAIEIHDSRALPARSLRKNPPALPRFLLARAVSRPFRLVEGTGGRD